MSNERQATVQPIEEESAMGRVADIFADIRKTKGLDFVPRFWRVIATNPVQLDIVWSSLKKLMHPDEVGGESRLSPAMREMIAVAVSASNGCSYCVNSHTTALKKHGVDDETLGEVLAIAGLFNMTNALADGYQIDPDVLPPLE